MEGYGTRWIVCKALSREPATLILSHAVSASSAKKIKRNTLLGHVWRSTKKGPPQDKCAGFPYPLEEKKHNLFWLEQMMSNHHAKKTTQLTFGCHSPIPL